MQCVVQLIAHFESCLLDQVECLKVTELWLEGYEDGGSCWQLRTGTIVSRLLNLKTCDLRDRVLGFKTGHES